MDYPVLYIHEYEGADPYIGVAADKKELIRHIAISHFDSASNLKKEEKDIVREMAAVLESGDVEAAANEGVRVYAPAVVATKMGENVVHVGRENKLDTAPTQMFLVEQAKGKPVVYCVTKGSRHNWDHAKSKWVFERKAVDGDMAGKRLTADAAKKLGIEE